MLLERFSDLIDRSGLGSVVEKKRELIDSTDPERIYVENVRSFFGLPPKLAEALCDLGAREGLLEMRIGYLCPQCNSLIGSRTPSESAPIRLHCVACEALGDAEKTDFEPAECRPIKFYRLING